MKKYILRAIQALLLLLVIAVAHTIYETRQANQMAVSACLRAVWGMKLEDYLKGFSPKEYSIARGSGYVLVVPKRGQGRNHCKVEHDGVKIGKATAGFID